MVIDQRNAGASVTAGAASAYFLDRWSFNCSQASKLSFQQNAGSVTLPAGFTNYLGATSLSAYTIGAGELFTVFQVIEGYNTSDLGWGTANAKTVTLSFQVYSSLTGTFGGSIRNYAGSRSYPFTYTISTANTWTTISVTIAGDTGGTTSWNLGSSTGSIIVWFGLGVGTTLSGTAGSWSGSNYVSATGATIGSTNYTAGYGIRTGGAAAGAIVRQGSCTMCLVGSNTWAESGVFSHSNEAANVLSAGNVTLGGTLDRVRITTSNGTDTFDAGSINILYE
jgi:hypothetical protein